MNIVAPSINVAVLDLIGEIMNWRQRMIILTIILIGLALSGCKAGQLFGPTVTPTFTPTATNTFTPTSTLTPSVTPSPIPSLTPTETPLEITTDLSGGLSEILKRIERVSIDDIESGRLTRQEKLMYERGEINNFTEINKPFPDGVLRLSRWVSWMTLIDLKGSEYRAPNLDTETIPYMVTDFSMVKIEEQDIMVMGVFYLNSDYSTSVLHYGFQSYKDWRVIITIDRIINKKFQILPVYEMTEETDKPTINNSTTGSVMFNWYQKNVEERKLMFDEWLETGVIPDELQNEIIMLEASPW